MKLVLKLRDGGAKSACRWCCRSEINTWVEKLEPEPGSKLEDAVKYARSQKQALNAFLRYGDVEISNNLAENAIRPFVVG